MGTHYNFYVLDDHLGLLAGRSREEEVEHIHELLKKGDFVVFRDPVYVPEGNCICFELRNCIPEDLEPILLYDSVYYRRECSSELKKL